MKIAFVYLNNDKNVSTGVGYLSSIMLQHGYEFDFFDTAYTPLQDVISKIQLNDYQILLISSTTVFYKDVTKLSQEVKKVKNIKILLGGIHTTIAKGSVLTDCQYIDYICIGEGEDFIIDFLNNYDKPSLFNIKNLGYRNEHGNIVINTVRDCTDLSKLSRLEYNLFPTPSVVQPYPLPGFCYVFATRGCPYNCSYCCNSYYLDLYKGSFLRKRNIDNIISELLYLKEKYPVKIFYFGDEMILFDIEYVSELFHRVKKEVQIPYGCMARVERINPTTVNLFLETGCKYVGMGVECGDENFRREFLNRKMSNDQIINAFHLLRSIKGITLTSYNMKGYPVHYDDILTKKTQELNKILKPDIMQLSTFYPFPGTKLYDYCIEHDLIDLNKLNTISDYFSQSVLKEIIC